MAAPTAPPKALPPPPWSDLPRPSSPSTTDAAPAPPVIFEHDIEKCRLGITTPSRLFGGTVGAGFVGAIIGSMNGGTMAQLRFRAEHAHKMPDTHTGWYFYHKSKNYHVMRGGIKEGFRLGAKTSFWCFMTLFLESAVDKRRGCSDMFSTIIASLTVAGSFSLWRRMGLATSARIARAGLLFGVAFGGAQDLLGYARGRPIGYVEWLRNGVFSRKQEPTDARPAI